MYEANSADLQASQNKVGIVINEAGDAGHWSLGDLPRC